MNLISLSHLSLGCDESPALLKLGSFRAAHHFSCACVLGSCRPEYCRIKDNQCCATRATTYRLIQCSIELESRDVVTRVCAHVPVRSCERRSLTRTDSAHTDRRHQTDAGRPTKASTRIQSTAQCRRQSGAARRAGTNEVTCEHQ